MIFLGFLLAVLLFVAGVALGGLDKLAIFVDTQSILFIVSGLLGFIFFFGRKEFGRGMSVFFAFSFPPSDESVETGRFFLRLTEFTLSWGLLGMVFGCVWTMSNLDPHTIGGPIAISLFSFLYASGLAVFVFLPIGLRLSPPTLPLSLLRWFSVRHLLLGLGGFFLMRCLVVVTLLLLSIAQKPDPRMGPIQPSEFGTVVQRAALTFNPADPQGEYSPFVNFRAIICYIDYPSLVLVIGGWWAFRLASGKRRELIAAPVVILIGVFWSIQGFCLMLADLDPNAIGAGFLVASLTTLYGFIAAAGFLLADMRRGFRDPPPQPPAEGMEEAKNIIDNVVRKAV